MCPLKSVVLLGGVLLCFVMVNRSSSDFCKMAKRFVYESAARKVQQLAVTHQATMLSPVPYRVSA